MLAVFDTEDQDSHRNHARSCDSLVSEVRTPSQVWSQALGRKAAATGTFALLLQEMHSNPRFDVDADITRLRRELQPNGLLQRAFDVDGSRPFCIIHGADRSSCSTPHDSHDCRQWQYGVPPLFSVAGALRFLGCMRGRALPRQGMGSRRQPGQHPALGGNRQFSQPSAQQVSASAAVVDRVPQTSAAAAAAAAVGQRVVASTTAPPQESSVVAQPSEQQQQVAVATNASTLNQHIELMLLLTRDNHAMAARLSRYEQQHPR